MSNLTNLLIHPLQSILNDLSINEELVNGTEVLLVYYILVIFFFLVDVYIDHNVKEGATCFQMKSLNAK